MAEVKIGDRVSVDSLKVGQPRRSGKVTEVSEGLSGTRYTVAWDDGTTTSFAPSSGNLIVERRRSSTRSKGSAGGTAKRASAKDGAKKPTAKRAKR